MQDGGFSPMYRALLARNPAPIFRVEVWRSGERVDTYGEDGLTILDGGISATLTSRVTRRCQLSLPLFMAPRDNLDLITPYGNEIVVKAGVSGYGGPNFLWSVFRGRITSVRVDDGRVAVSADDRAAELGNSYFEVPLNSNTGQSLILAWQELVTAALPDAQFGDSDAFGEHVPKLTFTDTRAAAADALADAGGAFWYTLGDGSFVMRKVPWTVEQDPILTWETGPDGVLIDGAYTLSRDEVFNKVTVVAEAADGSPPISATAFDNNPDSVTWLYGAFGEKGRRITSNAVLSEGAAYQLAVQYVFRGRALTTTWNTNIVADPALELGDCVTVNHLGRMDVQVVESFSLPLTGGNVMDVSLRALVPDSELEES